MGSLDVARAEIAFLVLYLNKAEARDKICRAIQYGAKFISNGEAGAASQVDKSTSLARKVFRLLKYMNEVQGLLAPSPKSTPLPIALLGKAKNALVGTFLFLDQLVWAGRTGIYKNKERTDLFSRLSLYSWLAGCVCASLVEISEVSRLAAAKKRIENELKQAKQIGNLDDIKLKEQRLKIAEQSHARSINLLKSLLDIGVAVGLLQLAPKSVTPRVTGGLGFITSLISCYQLLPPPAKSKSQ
ncbi:hypothetical protein O6H91_09G049700 [Diphasiastrum complanatum]|uniref:Uncharacterized protein n=1 Tax=Diphasiastrum complanatum TaxID=34168 RepID=A0ACC2CP88_DIPCM|nr:hypothetical protein O6H91_09G049700 [Diphasiastrum complanatum]